MTMFFPLGELIDRYVIAKLKFDRSQDNQLEFNFYHEQISHINLDLVSKEIVELYNIHCQIWDLESQLMHGVEDQLSLEVIGKCAIEIRDCNKQRIILKNSIAKILADSVQEVKFNHLSE